MTSNEIKKALYKQKPMARKLRMKPQEELPKSLQGVFTYSATLTMESGGGYMLIFKVPIEEAANFKDEEPAQLLIRWLEV